MAGSNRILGQGQTGNSSRLHTFSDSRMCIVLYIVSDDVALYIVHHTTIERYIAARIYSVEKNIYGDKSVMRLLSVNCLHV